MGISKRRLILPHLTNGKCLTTDSPNCGKKRKKKKERQKKRKKERQKERKKERKTHKQNGVNSG